MAVLADGTLDEAQRQRKLATLDAALPPAQRLARDAPQQVSALDAAVRDLRAHGGGDNDVYWLRGDVFAASGSATGGTRSRGSAVAAAYYCLARADGGAGRGGDLEHLGGVATPTGMPYLLPWLAILFATPAMWHCGHTSGR